MELEPDVLRTTSEEETIAFGEQFAAWLEIGDVVGISGDLGAGKTALVRALVRGLGVTGSVKSPTFTLLEPYVVSRLDFYHFDFYRFSEAAEFDLAGFRELFGPGRICAVEWPERAKGRLPTADLALTLQVKDDGRIAQCAAASDAGVQCLQEVMRTMQAPAADS